MTIASLLVRSSCVMSGQLLKEIRGNVGILTLNRPDKLNAWTGPMSTELYDSMKAFENDENVGAIVVTGAGRGFCAGADMGGLVCCACAAVVVCVVCALYLTLSMLVV